jgi:hypothetical protein
VDTFTAERYSQIHLSALRPAGCRTSAIWPAGCQAAPAAGFHAGVAHTAAGGSFVWCLQGFKKLQLLLRAILLRRTKGSTINGTPIINLPERRQELVKVQLSRDEADFYKQVGGHVLILLGRRELVGGGGHALHACHG